MDILPINNMIRIIDSGPHDDRQTSSKRQQPRKKEKIASRPMYTPDGHLDETALPKIDIVA